MTEAAIQFTQGGIQLNRNRLAICDPEQEYAYRLMDALSHREEFPFEIFTFTSTQKLRECLTDRPVEFLLLPETAFHADMEGRLASKILLLWDTDGEHCPDLPGISKYSGVTKIMKKIMETASQNGSVSFLPAVQTDHSVRFLGIYTPVSRCLQTTFAFAMGQLLAAVCDQSLFQILHMPCKGRRDGSQIAFPEGGVKG